MWPKQKEQMGFTSQAKISFFSIWQQKLTLFGPVKNLVFEVLGVEHWSPLGPITRFPWLLRERPV